LNVVGPPPEDFSARLNSYLIVKLTATDSQGASTTVTRIVQPNKVVITLATVPKGLNVTASGVSFKAPVSFYSWGGWVFRVTTPHTQGTWVFVKWSDGKGRIHDIKTPLNPTTYTATFRAN
jgi:hypothetical protein